MYQSDAWRSQRQPQLDGHFFIEGDALPAECYAGPTDCLWQPLDLVGRILNWLTSGRVRWWQCTSPAVAALRARGYDVPQSVVTPRRLWEYLDEQGFDYCRHP